MKSFPANNYLNLFQTASGKRLGSKKPKKNNKTNENSRKKNTAQLNTFTKHIHKIQTKNPRVLV